MVRSKMIQLMIKESWDLTEPVILVISESRILIGRERQLAIPN